MVERRAPMRPKDEVRRQILVAARELLAEDLPANVSVRQIADRAGVQHSLVHRHFETKDQLVAEVMAITLEEYASAVRNAESPEDGYAAALDYFLANRASLFLLAGTAMGPSGEQISARSFPGAQAHRQQLFDRGAPDDEQTRTAVVAMIALTAGWAFFEDWWLAAGGLDESTRDAARAKVLDIISRTARDVLAPGEGDVRAGGRAE